MTLLIILAPFAAAMGAVVGYVAWRDRRRRGAHIDPSISRDALAQADRGAVQGRLAAEGMPDTRILGGGPGSHHGDYRP